MTRHLQPIDFRPFQPKAKLDSQQSLVARYGAIAIQEVAEALHHLKPNQAEKPVARAA